MAGLTIKSATVVVTLVAFTILSLRTEISNGVFRTSEPSQKLRSDTIFHVTSDDNLRILNFGTSVSWGAGLENRYDSYPYLLNINATNLAIRAQGPCFPSVCTQTMVGNEAVYDVITLEFFSRSTQGLLRLAKRLRKRYPQAVIIVIRRWNPLSFKHLPSDLDFQTWMDGHGYRDADKSYKLHDPEFHQELYSTTSPDEWFFTVDEKELQVQDKTVEAVGAFLLDLPRPPDFREAIAEMSHWFSPDMNHLSREGHEFIASEIQYILNVMGATQKNEIGSWGGEDYCESWFLSGKAELARDDSVRMVEFDEKNGKWALEIPPADGWITVMNPFDEPMSLFLTYMVTGPPPSIYPETSVYLGEENYYNNLGTFLDPSVENPGPKEHIGKTTLVGSIAPGETTLWFRYCREGDERRDNLFRITGYAIVGLDGDVSDAD